MKSIFVSYTAFAASLAFGLLASPAFAASDVVKDAGVNNIYNIAFGVGSLVFVLAGIWILRRNMKLPPRGGK